MRMPVVKMSDTVRDCTFNVRVSLRRDLRFRIGLWLVQLGVWVWRSSVRVEHEGDAA